MFKTELCCPICLRTLIVTGGTPTELVANVVVSGWQSGYINPQFTTWACDEDYMCDEAILDPMTPAIHSKILTDNTGKWRLYGYT